MSGEDKFINGLAVGKGLFDGDVCDTVILQSFECGHQ